MTAVRQAPPLSAQPDVDIFDDDRGPQELARVANEPDVAWFSLDGERAPHEDAFWRNVAQAMTFPDYDGENRSALDACLQDPSWVPAAGYVLLYDGFERFARANPAAWEIALDVFRTAVGSWWGEGIPMYVRLRGDAAAAPGPPTLRLPAALAAPGPSPRATAPGGRSSSAVRAGPPADRRPKHRSPPLDAAPRDAARPHR